MTEGNFEYTDYLLRYDVLYDTNNIFANGAFKADDGRVVPIVHQGDGHNHYDALTLLGYALLEHREDGVIAKCTFADYDYGKLAKGLVVDTKEMGLSVYANQIRYDETAIPIHRILSGHILAVIVVPMGDMPRPKKEIE